jgi:hypothetical protein
MRLSLFDRLRQFARWRVGAPAPSRNRKHRKGGVPSPRPAARQRHTGISQQYSAEPSPWERTAQVPPWERTAHVPPWERSPGPAPQPPPPRTDVSPRNGPGHPGTGPGSYPGLATNYDGSGDHRAAGGAERPAGIGGGAGRARIREAPFGVAPAESARVSPEVPRQAQSAARQPWYHVVGDPAAAARQPPGQMRPVDAAGLADRTGLADTAGLAASGPGTASPAEPVVPAGAMRAAGAALPFAAPHPRGHPPTADGRRNCGPLEAVLWRQWDEAATPPPELVAAVERLAEFPRQLKEKLAAGLDAIYLGPGGVPELDDMTSLRGVPLPSGRATWDACAGAYGERKIVVGSRPSPTPDVMCHEVGHALDDLDSPPGKWQSDSAEFRLTYDQCQPYIASDFHRQRGGLGRKEFFADAFAAIASGQRPALVDMLDGNTRIALRVMLYFNRRYGI